jgi:hypothetical protein
MRGKVKLTDPMIDYSCFQLQLTLRAAFLLDPFSLWAISMATGAESLPCCAGAKAEVVAATAKKVQSVNFMVTASFLGNSKLQRQG